MGNREYKPKRFAVIGAGPVGSIVAAFRAKVARTTTRVDDLAGDPPDVAIVAVKATALPLIASALEGVAAGGRYVVSWQNGVDTERVLAKPLGAVTGKTMGEVIDDPILFHLVDALIKEGVAVARANEFTLGSNFYPYCIDYIRNAGHHKPSMLQDIEAGRRTEVDYINGKIVEYGAQAGVATPYNTMIRGIVKALEPK